MLRKFYYLTSVSVLASMSMNLAAQAMNPDDSGFTPKSGLFKNPQDGSQKRSQRTIEIKKNVNDIIADDIYYNSANFVRIFNRIKPTESKDPIQKSRISVAFEHGSAALSSAIHYTTESVCYLGEIIDKKIDPYLNYFEEKSAYGETPVGFPEEFENFSIAKSGISYVGKMSKDYIVETISPGIGEKCNTLFKIKNEFREGKYITLTGEVIELLIAKYAGQGEKNFYKKSSGEFDKDLILNASKQLATGFCEFLAKDKTRYGKTEDGKRVALYYSSLFRMFAENTIPDIPIVKTAAISLLDNDYCKDYITGKLIEKVYDYLQAYLGEGETLKEAAAKKTINFAHSMLCDESSVDFGQIWECLSPYVNSNLRQYILPIIKGLKNKVIKSHSKDFYNVIVPTAGKVAGGVVGSAMAIITLPFNLYYTLSNNNKLGVAGTIGAGCNAVGTSIAVGTAFGIPTQFLVQQRIRASYEGLEKDASQRLDDEFDRFANGLIPYTREEHALGLYDGPDENINQIIRGLLQDDYDFRDELRTGTRIAKSLEGFAKSLKLDGNCFFDYVFGTSKPIFGHCNHENQESAYRKFTMMRLKNSEEYEKIKEILENYPSFAAKVKYFNHLNGVSLETVTAEQEELVESYKYYEAILRELQDAAGVLAKSLYRQYDTNLDIQHVLFDEIQNSPTQIQDNIIEWVNNRPEELNEFVLNFVSKNKLNDLYKIDNEEKVVDKNKIREFFDSLKKECLQGYIEEDVRNYVKINQDSMQALSTSLLGEKMVETQLYHLHSHLMHLVSCTSTEYLLKLPEDMILKMGQLLKNKVLGEFPKISKEFQQVLEIKNERRKGFKPEIEILHFDQGALSSLDIEYGEYAKKHLNELRMVETIYHTLLDNHTAWLLNNILFEELETTKLLLKIKGEYISEVLEKKAEEFSLPNVKEVVDALCEKLMQSKIYTDVNKMTKNIRGDTQETTIGKMFHIERYRRLEPTAESVIKTLEETKKNIENLNSTLTIKKNQLIELRQKAEEEKAEEEKAVTEIQSSSQKTSWLFSGWTKTSGVSEEEVSAQTSLDMGKEKRDEKLELEEKNLEGDILQIQIQIVETLKSFKAALPKLTRSKFSQETFDEKFSEGQKKIILFDNTDEQCKKLYRVIEKMCDNHSNLSLKDFIGIHKTIMNLNFHTTDWSAERGSKEYYNYMLESSEFSDKLFFDISVVKAAIENDNKNFVEKLRNL